MTDLLKINSRESMSHPVRTEWWFWDGDDWVGPFDDEGEAQEAMERSQ